MQMFHEQSFEVFTIEGLDARMQAIRTEIQPIFQGLAEDFVRQLEPAIGKVLPIHIAQHRRRTAHAPDFTWCALGGDARGYKKYPHFTLGINEAYLVMWLSLIDNPLHEKAIATDFLEKEELFHALPKEMVLNTDHTKNNYLIFDENALKESLTRFRDVKKGEFQIGRKIDRGSALLQKPTEASDYMIETYQALVPLYLQALHTQQQFME